MNTHTSYSRRFFLNRLAHGVTAAVIGSAANSPASVRLTEDRARTTGYVSDTRYRIHSLGVNHPESPQRLAVIETRLEKSGILGNVINIPPDEDPGESIGAIHSSAHCQSIRAIKTTGDIATLAVQGALSAVKSVAAGQVRNAFCAIRPPGHHALNTGREEGFCFFNNVAIAARYAQKECGLDKILIIDWDYHHGNGTEWAFYDDPTVLFFSTHNRRAYPGTGDPARKGEGPGHGFNINVHLGCGTTDKEMLSAWEKMLIPAAEKFKPDLVLISAGFDSRVDDTLGCYKVTDYGFMEMTRLAMEIARACSSQRLVSLLEGGYNLEGLANAVDVHLRALIEG